MVELKKFLADGMVGRLARWMRLIGCDVTYLSAAQDEQLIQKAAAENRVLLTSDTVLYRLAVARGVEAFLVKGNSEADKLARVTKRFGIRLEVDTSTSRCPTCGSLIESVSKDSVKARVPPTTFEAYEEFWICTNPKCRKIYWQGSHWKKIHELLKEANQLATAKKQQ